MHPHETAYTHSIAYNTLGITRQFRDEFKRSPFLPPERLLAHTHTDTKRREREKSINLLSL
jgi:hypothetical protein